MTEDPRHLIADHLTPASEEPAPPTPDVKAHSCYHHRLPPDDPPPR